MRTIRPYVIVLALLSITSAGCATPRMVSSSQFLSGAVTSLPQPTPAPSGFARGRFSAISAPNMVLLSIENDGHFRLFVDDVLLDSGEFSVAGSQVLVESSVCERQKYRPALYNWLYDEDGLAFQSAASDPCPERQQYLSEIYQPKYTFVFNIPDRGPSREWLW